MSEVEPIEWRRLHERPDVPRRVLDELATADHRYEYLALSGLRFVRRYAYKDRSIEESPRFTVRHAEAMWRAIKGDDTQ